MVTQRQVHDDSSRCIHHTLQGTEWLTLADETVDLIRYLHALSAETVDCDACAGGRRERAGDRATDAARRTSAQSKEVGRR